MNITIGMLKAARLSISKNLGELLINPSKDEVINHIIESAFRAMLWQAEREAKPSHISLDEINGMAISSKAKKILLSYGVQSLGDLSYVRRDMLLRIDGCGEKTASEIMDAIATIAKK